MRSARQLSPVLLAPIIALALVSFTVHFFSHPDPEFPLSGDSLVMQLMNEAGWTSWPICLLGLAAVWFGRSVSRPGIAMYALVPLWGVSLAALNLNVWGAQKAVAICTPASRELDQSMKVRQLPGAEWVNPPLSNQALVDASLIALSHGHVLVLQVR